MVEVGHAAIELPLLLQQFWIVKSCILIKPVPCVIFINQLPETFCQLFQKADPPQASLPEPGRVNFASPSMKVLSVPLPIKLIL